MARLLALFLVALSLTAPAWATPARVQDSGWVVSSVSNTDVTLTGVTAGNNIIVLIVGVNSAVRTYTVDDDQTVGCYSETVINVNGTSFRDSIWRCLNHPGGTTVITVDQSGVHDSYAVLVVEVSTAGGTTLADDDSVAWDDATSDTTQNAADTTGFDPSAGVFVVAVIRATGSMATPSACASYTFLGTAASTYAAVYRTSASALPSEVPCLTHTSTARTSENVSASFKEVGGASSPKRGLMLGVGE